MTRKSAAAVQQPDLLGGAAPPKVDAPKSTATKVKPKAEPTAKPAENKGHLTVVKNNPPNTLALIAEALKDPNFKPENMRLVLDMHKEMCAEQARLDFVADFIAMKALLPVINRDGKIVIVAKGADGKRPETGGRVQQSTPYATFENICRVVDPLLQQFGFALTFATEPTPDGSRLIVKGLLDHKSGHQRTTSFPLPAETSGSKNNVQGWGSSFSYGKRYATIALLNIRTAAPDDRDLDGNAAKRTKAGKPVVVEGEVLVETKRPEDEQVDVCSEEQLMAVRDAIAACGVSEKTFCSKFNITKVAQLPTARYDDAIQACRNFEAARK